MAASAVKPSSTIASSAPSPVPPAGQSASGRALHYPRRAGRSRPDVTGEGPCMLILGIILFGVIAGWVARTLLGRSDLSWGRTILFGLIGSFVGGLLFSLLAGDGLALRPSGLIGSILGAIIVILIDQLITGRGRARS